MGQVYDPFSDPYLGDGLHGGMIPTPPDEYAKVWAYPRPTVVPQGMLVNHDLRAYKGQSLFPPIGDQGALGSCAAWTFGYYLRAALASKWHVDNGTTPDLPDTLSPRYLYDVTRSRMGTYPSDSGSDMKTAASVLLDYGCAPERDMPYTGKADNGPVGAELTDHVSQAAAFYSVSSYYRIAGTGQTLLDGIIAALHQGQPVALAILVEQPLMNTGSSGKVPSPNPNATILGGHALCCAGNYYDQSAPGGLWLPCMGSWGASRGDGGVYYIPASYALVNHARYGPFLQEAWACA